jgi:hypothetical protein
VTRTITMRDGVDARRKRERDAPSYRSVPCAATRARITR